PPPPPPPPHPTLFRSLDADDPARSPRCDAEARGSRAGGLIGFHRGQLQTQRLLQLQRATDITTKISHSSIATNAALAPYIATSRDRKSTRLNSSHQII